MARRAEKSLSGLRVLVTRPRHQAGTLVERLRRLGADPVELSMIEIAPLEDYSQLDVALARLDQYDRIIFTSANGVAAVFDRHALGVRASRAHSIIAIGPATAAALAQRGINATWFPSEYVAEAIVREIGDVAGQRILLPRADIARQALAAGLRARGAIVDAIAAYRTVPAPGSAEALDRILERGVDVVTFLSSSTVRHFASLADRGRLDGVLIACIGPITAATAGELGFHADIVAREYTADGLVEAIRAYVRDKR